LRDSKTVVVANVSSAVTLAVFCCHQTCRPQSPNWYQQLSGSRPAWTNLCRPGRGLSRCGAAMVTFLHFGLSRYI
jgi:hypothetical protein